MLGASCQGGWTPDTTGSVPPRHALGGTADGFPPSAAIRPYATYEGWSAEPRGGTATRSETAASATTATRRGFGRTPAGTARRPSATAMEPSTAAAQSSAVTTADDGWRSRFHGGDRVRGPTGGTAADGPSTAVSASRAPDPAPATTAVRPRRAPAGASTAAVSAVTGARAALRSAAAGAGRAAGRRAGHAGPRARGRRPGTGGPGAADRASLHP